MTTADRLARIKRAVAVAAHREDTAIRETIAHLEAVEDADEAYLDELAEARSLAVRRQVLLVVAQARVEQEARDARAAIPAEALIEAAKRARPESAP